MALLLAAGGGLLSPSLMTILLFVIVFALLNIREKGRWD